MNKTPRGPIGEALRAAGIPVNTMAEACHVSNKTAWRWAMGESRPLPLYRKKLHSWMKRKVDPEFDLDEALK